MRVCVAIKGTEMDSCGKENILYLDCTNVSILFDIIF